MLELRTIWLSPCSLPSVVCSVVSASPSPALIVLVASSLFGSALSCPIPLLAPLAHFPARLLGSTNGPRATRTPRLLPRFDGTLPLRVADQQTPAGYSQLPPRYTRSEPFGGPP